MDDRFQLTEHADQTLDERMWMGTGPQGMRTVVVPKPGRATSMLFLAVRFGSVDVTFRQDPDAAFTSVPSGTAHFLEHELFKKEDEDMMQVLSARGAEANAMTMYSMTGYYASTSDDLTDCVAPMFRTVLDPYFDPGFVEREKQIIRQELMMYMDRPGYRLYRSGMENLYQNHPLQYDIGGRVEDIDDITPELLQTCHDAFYHPENLTLVVAGSDVENGVLDRCAEEIEKRSVPERPATKRSYPDEPAEPDNASVECTFHTTRPRVLVGFKDRCDSLDGPELIEQEIEMSMALELLFGESSPFRMELLEEGLIDDSFDFQHHGDQTFGFTIVSGKTEQPETLIDRITGGIEEIQNSGLEKKPFERLKKGLKGQYIRFFDSVRSNVFRLFPYCFLDITPYEVRRTIEQTTLDDLIECFRTRLDANRRVSVIMRPEDGASGAGDEPAS